MKYLVALIIAVFSILPLRAELLTPTEREELVGWIKTNVQEIKEFGVEQTPLFAQEIIAYTMLYNVMFAVASALLIVGVMFIQSRFGRIDNKVDRFIITVVFSVVYAMIAFITMEFVLKVVKCKVAPRVVVVDAVLRRLNPEPKK